MDLKARAKNIKAIFFDIDGTLFSNRTHRVLKSTTEALMTAKQNGILLFVATGRHKWQVENIKEIADIGFDGYITLNGQCCYDREGAVVYKHPIDPADVKRLEEYARKAVIPCFFCEADSIYVNFVNDYVIQEHAAVRSPVPEVRDVSRVYEREILQMGLYLSDKGIPDILAEMPNCTYTRWKTDGVDIIPAGSSKRDGMEQIMKRFGLSPEQTMSFGDNDNDVEMLMHSGISVAMGNAEDNVKAVSDYVTDDVDDDGIANAMKFFF